MHSMRSSRIKFLMARESDGEDSLYFGRVDFVLGAGIDFRGGLMNTVAGQDVYSQYTID